MTNSDRSGVAAFAHAIGDALFAEAMAEAHHRANGRSIVVGFSGSQGAGKSTRVTKLVERLRDRGLVAAVLALDNFYLTGAERAVLARQVHPLLRTRGVPGTHDIPLLVTTIESLLGASATERTAVPRFDKVRDDRVGSSDWTSLIGKPDIVLLEGWCVGARAEPSNALLTPVNDLERTGDADGTWRAYVNARLETDYAALFERLDLRLMLRAPDFSRIVQWKLEQERSLPRDPSRDRPAPDLVAMTRFVSHYERLTRWMLTDEPAHLIADLDWQRAPVAWRRREDLAHVISNRWLDVSTGSPLRP